MSVSAWFTFVLMMAAIAYTPGPMTMFSMSSSLRHGFFRTLPGIFGGSGAYMVQMAVAYLGLGMVVQNSVVVFNAIKWAGVAYLIVLGVKNWQARPRRDQADHPPTPVHPAKQVALGFATGMSNPKSVLVFTVLFPQFISPDQYTAHFLILAVSFFFIQGSSAVAYALFGAKIFRWMQARHLERLQTRITAAILFTAGGLLALSRK